jgi:hypothetical protein
MFSDDIAGQDSEKNELFFGSFTDDAFASVNANYGQSTAQRSATEWPSASAARSEHLSPCDPKRIYTHPN